MAEAFQCDRCTEFRLVSAEDELEPTCFAVTDPIDETPYTTIELCAVCYRAFNDWLDMDTPPA